jgi:hypothetical protein
MKILVDREDIEAILSELQQDNFYDGHANAVKLVKMILQDNSESTFPVYHSCPICGQTIYLTDPHKCNGPYKRY